MNMDIYFNMFIEVKAKELEYQTTGLSVQDLKSFIVIEHLPVK